MVTQPASTSSLGDTNQMELERPHEGFRTIIILRVAMIRRERIEQIHWGPSFVFAFVNDSIYTGSFRWNHRSMVILRSICDLFQLLRTSRHAAVMYLFHYSLQVLCIFTHAIIAVSLLLPWISGMFQVIHYVSPITILRYRLSSG